MEHAGGGGGGGGGGGVRPSGGSFFKNPIPRNRRGARFFEKIGGMLDCFQQVLT